ncbi:MAG: RNA polymerase sigma factor [Marmoricola sp.]
MRADDVVIDDRDDADLLAAARVGDTTCADVLWVRTWPSALAVARYVADDPTEAEDLASEAMTSVFAAISRGAGPTDAVRAYVATSVRNLHTSALRRRARTGTPVALDDERTLSLVADQPDVIESHLVAKAFEALPARWRFVLWSTLVEGRDGGEVAGELGIRPSAVYALKARALEGLRQGYLTAHAQRGRAEECVAVHRNLAATVRSRSRRAADEQQTWRHLRSCAHCAEAYRELSAINSRIGAVLGPVAVGLVVLGKEHARLGLLAGLRSQATGTQIATAAAAVAGVVAATSLAVHQVDRDPLPSAGRSASTAAAARTGTSGGPESSSVPSPGSSGSTSRTAPGPGSAACALDPATAATRGLDLAPVLGLAPAAAAVPAAPCAAPGLPGPLVPLPALPAGALEAPRLALPKLPKLPNGAAAVPVAPPAPTAVPLPALPSTLPTLAAAPLPG